MSFKKKIISEIVQNIVFWSISFGLTLKLFSPVDEIRLIDVIYTFLFHIPFIAIVTINIYHLVPNILKKVNFWVYLAVVHIAGFGLTLFLYRLSFGVITNFLFPDYYFVALYSPLEILGFMLIYVSISTLIELSKAWFGRKETELKLTQLQEDKTRTELKALRAQINPHFLFNNLNTIYGEALKKSEKAPTMILKLSSILRYIVENMDKDEVLLEAEVEYLTMYIDLQKERLTNPFRVSFKTSGDFSTAKVSPLLLVNFVENCFKHGTTSDVNDRISISLTFEDGRLTFSTSNSISKSENIEKTKSGTGIKNAKKRLAFLYPNKHSINISQNEENYNLELKLDLS